MPLYGLRTSFARWSPDEDEILRTWGPNYAELIPRLPKRSRVAIKFRLRLLSLSVPKKPWEGWEDALVEDRYPDYEMLQKLLPHRTKAAIWSRVRDLNLLPAKKMWNRFEINKVVKMRAGGASRREIAACFPGTSIESIACLLYKHGETRPRNLYDGPQEIRSIRERAKKLGVPLKHLDMRAGSNNYFKGGRRMILPKHLVRAIDVLGGSFTIEWDEPNRPT